MPLFNNKKLYLGDELVSVPDLFERRKFIGHSPTTFTINPPNGAVTTTSITADVAVHTKGAWVAITNAFAEDSNFLEIVFGSTGSNAVDGRGLLDLAVGVSGPDVVIADDVVIGASGSISRVFLTKVLAGERVWARWQAAVTARVVVVRVVSWMAPFKTTTQTIRLTTTTPASSSGQTLPAPAGNNVPGAWVQLTPSCPANIQAVHIGVQYTAGTSFSSVQLARGAPGAESVIESAEALVVGSSSETLAVYLAPTRGVSIKAGERISARLIRGAASNTNVTVSVHGMPVG